MRLSCKIIVCSQAHLYLDMSGTIERFIMSIHLLHIAARLVIGQDG